MVLLIVLLKMLPLLIALMRFSSEAFLNIPKVLYEQRCGQQFVFAFWSFQCFTK
jgi:hypothetical protein